MMDDRYRWVFLIVIQDMMWETWSLFMKGWAVMATPGMAGYRRGINDENNHLSNQKLLTIDICHLAKFALT